MFLGRKPRFFLLLVSDMGKRAAQPLFSPYLKKNMKSHSDRRDGFVFQILIFILINSVNNAIVGFEFYVSIVFLSKLNLIFLNRNKKSIPKTPSANSVI